MYSQSGPLRGFKNMIKFLGTLGLLEVHPPLVAVIHSLHTFVAQCMKKNETIADLQITLHNFSGE